MAGPGFSREIVFLLGEKFSGKLGRDGWRPWQVLACLAQSCLAHHLERCRELLLEAMAGQARFPLGVNWPAEQAIRPAVINRKTSGGSRSGAGAEAQGVLMSLIRSARQQNRDPVELFVRLLHAPAPLVLDIVPPCASTRCAKAVSEPARPEA